MFSVAANGRREGKSNHRSPCQPAAGCLGVEIAPRADQFRTHFSPDRPCGISMGARQWQQPPGQSETWHNLFAAPEAVARAHKFEARILRTIVVFGAVCWISPWQDMEITGPLAACDLGNPVMQQACVMGADVREARAHW